MLSRFFRADSIFLSFLVVTYTKTGTTVISALCSCLLWLSVAFSWPHRTTNSSATCSLRFFCSLLTDFSLSSSLRFFLSIDMMASFCSLASSSPVGLSVSALLPSSLSVLVFYGFCIHCKQICRPASRIGIAWA